jgi:hypothetical protein
VVLLFTFVFVAAIGYWFWHLAARRTSRHYAWQLLWRLACVIAALRISALWLGIATNYSSGWVQIPGQFLQLLGLPELYFVRQMRATPVSWALVGSTLLIASSFFWAALLIWIANQLHARKNIAR